MLKSTLLIAILLASVPAWGQTTLTPPVNADAEVRRLFAEGVQAADQLQWEKARKLFEQAFALQPNPKIAANLGRAELMLGKPCAAAEHFEYYLTKQGVDEPDADSRQVVEDVLREARAKAPMLQVKVEVEGAGVFVNGKNVGESPLKTPLCVEPGNYTVEARAPGRTPAQKEVGIAAGARLEVLLNPEPFKPEPSSLPPRMQEPPAWRVPVILGGAAFTAIGLSVGIGYSFATAEKNPVIDKEADRLQQTVSPSQPICSGRDDPQCRHLFALGDEQRTYRNVAIAGYSAAGAFALGTLIFAYMTRPTTNTEKRSSPVKVVLVPSMSGFHVSGTFE